MPSNGRPYDTRFYYLLQCGYKRDSVHCPTMAALHDQKVRAADLLNAYVMAPNREKIWIVLVQTLGVMLVSMQLFSEH